MNTAGYYKCTSTTCDEGYERDRLSLNCSDIDECQLIPPPCGSDGVRVPACKNTPGSFDCNCTSGYAGKPCADVDECLVYNVCGAGGNCNNKPGSYECTCREGFNMSHLKCEDINECLASQCEGNGTCKNSQGSFHCECEEGYSGPDCTDIDECSAGPCFSSTDCRNIHGSFECECIPGFTGRLCDEDLNECKISASLARCGPGQRCQNTNGSFVCECADAGFRLNGTGHGQCVDINECEKYPCGGEGNICKNTNGTFECSCTTGFLQHGHGVCTDEDECKDSARCGYGQCENTLGSFSCDCFAGFVLSSKRGMCVNSSECTEVSEDCGPAGKCISARAFDLM